MINVLLVFGTRPEAIKMCPLILELKKRDNIKTTVCITGQHREMLHQVLNVFNIRADIDLDIMRDKQTLFDITSSILVKLRTVFEQYKPNLVLVHGDTTSSFTAALAAYYHKIDVGHVEAGLRTYNIYSPFPEEFNRQSVGLISKYHFTPTQASHDNLVREGKKERHIFITGNTAIDALKTTIHLDYKHELLDWIGDSKLILITAHRRENLGEPMHNMFRAINRIINENSNLKAIYPIHMNPAVRNIASEVLGSNSRIKIIEPLEVIDFHNIMSKSYIILTDSGGIQEEAPSLGIPVLVMRDTTERPEGIEAGTLKLVGTSEETIYNNFNELLNDIDLYKKMSSASNPYGDGTACIKIADIIENEYKEEI
jgi:UDP-N-acetylglucosamine 2-epimerase (non-hydrolysing)